MRELHFESNGLIFRAGDTADFAFIITQGEVEVAVPDSGHAPERLGPGAVFGQVAVILDQPRRRTARALSDVTVLAISRSEFLRNLNARYGIVEPFLRRLFATLHDAEGLAERGPPPPSQLEAEAERPPALAPHSPTAPAAAFTIRMAATSEALVEQLGKGGIAVDGLPFRVGRQPSKGESLPPGGLDLTLHDAKPFNLSRRHFAIEAGPEQPLVRDIGSQLGTIVNGARIGGSEPVRTAPLDPGENSVIAGREGSPFVFTILVSSP